ncbi:hypothetical protein CPT32_28205 [Rhizobium sophoriradicis]|uniref:hypothetical protein n=1 Tax=Rhizobium sophoriradicis TaxID=1535245 RepID=UPI000BBD7336|nr:hypothetical protein [Rhizobium sophoriradicis]PCK83609.1 hypothetical protein CPT32_28205 [Rhizobium sophoriradicis]
MGGKATKVKTQRANKGAGRPRKTNVERFPCGKIKPFETEKDNVSVAVAARRRIHGFNRTVDDETVRSPYAGYTLGRMFLDGVITDEQRQAGDDYAEAMARYHKTTGIPAPSPRAQSLFAVKGHEGEVTESLAERARKASNRMMALQAILLACEDGPQVKSTVYNVAVMDYDHLRHMPPQQVLWLRRGLIALRKSRGG